MSTPTQQPSSIQLTHTNRITSSPRKLPIKRKTPPQNQNHHPSTINPISSLNHTPPTLAVYDDNDYDYNDDELDDESHESKPPPFKFHRIWSESDEIRFLQGLLGCWSQGLIFPRDLNVFYDRFSESMPQPYTRSQLSEKLRRLRKKFKIITGRIAAGQDANRLAPHDRDLLHLCTRLWDPSHASTSPFSAADPASSGGTVGNKRRRRSRPSDAGKENRHLEFGTTEKKKQDERVVDTIEVVDTSKNEENNGNSIGHVVAKTVMDVFDSSLKELRVGLLAESLSGGELSRRWQELRIEELDVFARRLRLVLEQFLQS